jgi:hypothetical protein
MKSAQIPSANATTTTTTTINSSITKTIDDDTTQQVASHPPPRRRTEAQCRNEHLVKGAILLQFAIDDDHHHHHSLSKNEHQWRTVEKKGFLVTTTTGCLIPHKNHWFENRQRIIASVASLEFFYGKSVNPKTNGTVNKHGWPCDEQVSHLCHRSSCCSPLHLCIEKRWQNQKRNYCGLNGSCDCGMTPPCLSTYHNKEFHDDEEEVEYLSYSTPGLSQKVKRLLGCCCSSGIMVKILPKNHYHKEDTKRANRLKRRKGGIRTKKQTQRKRRRTALSSYTLNK